MVAVDLATPVRASRLAALSILLGIVLLLGAFFVPLIIRITYARQVGCPTGPDCPPPATDVTTFGDGWLPFFLSGRLLTADGVLAFLWGPAPFLALIILQAAIAWRA
jgi:hypothetical protein